MMTFQKVLTNSTKIDVFKEPIHRYIGVIKGNHLNRSQSRNVIIFQKQRYKRYKSYKRYKRYKRLNLHISYV